MKSKSVRRSAVVLSMVMLALPVAVFSMRAQQMTQSQPVLNLQEYTVRRESLDVTISAIGTIQADQTARLSFTTAGRVAEVVFQQGSYVLAGDVLAQLENEAQRLSVEQAQVALQIAQAQKDKLLLGADESQIRVAQANVQAAQGAALSAQNVVRPEQIQAAELQYQQAQEALRAAQQARATAPGDQPQEAYDLLDARIGQASFNVEIARLQLEALQRGNSGQVGAAYARVQQAQRELERLQAGPTQAQIDQADALIAQQQIAVERAQRALDNTRIVAPFDGWLAAVNIDEGGLVAPGAAAFQLVDTDPLRLTVQVDEIDVRQIREGMPARVKIDALPGVELNATLERIGLVGTNNGGVVSYAVDVRLDDSDSRVRVGMTAEALVVIESREDVLIVPNTYIRLDRQRGTAYVNVPQPDGTLREIEVILGLQGADRSEIVAGLREGEVIAVDLSGDRIGLFG